MTNKRRHSIAAILCLLAAFLILLYYRITRYGNIDISLNTVWKTLALGVFLFLGLETVDFISKKMIQPFFIEGKPSIAYLVIYIAMLICSVVFVLAYRRIRYETFHIELKTVLTILLLSIGLFIFFCIEIQIAKRTIGEKTSFFSFSSNALTATVFCVAVISICFIPVISDCAFQEYPQAYNMPMLVSMEGKTGLGVVGEITEGNHIIQSFECTCDGIYSITLEGATYIRRNTGTLKIVLENEESGEIDQQWLMDASKFRDNSNFTIVRNEPFSKLDMKGKRYRIDISSDDATEGNALTVYYVKNDYYPNGNLSVNGEKIDGDLYMTILGISKPVSYEHVRIILCFSFAVLAEAIILFLFHRHSNQKKQ